MDTKKLRQKILDLAIRGMLVPQDPNDEPASVLLERIRAEKEQLIKEGKIKRSKKSAATDTSHYENVPFVIPESWCWTSIGELFEHNTGKALNASNRDGKMMDYITTSNLYWDRFDLSVVKQMLFTEEELWRCTAKKGDLLICEGGDIGRAAIWNYDYDIRIQNHIHRLRGYGGINHRFYYFVFLLYKLSNRIGGKGVAIQGLSSGDLHKLEVPLPPECEQIRLVKTIDKWFKFVDLLEQEQENLHSLAQSTKSKILGLAISGKLVPQDPNDEPAIELLKRINPAFEPCDNSHYENLPQGWVKLRLGDVCSFERGITFPSSAKCTIKQPGLIACIRTANVQDNLELDDLWYVGNEYIKGNTEKLVRKNDIIMSSANSRELVGKVSYVHDIPEEMTFGGFVLNIRANEGILPFFLFLMLKTLYLKGYYLTIATQTTNIANLNTKILGDIEVLLPPLTEQERIINSVTDILASIENITVEL